MCGQSLRIQTPLLQVTSREERQRRGNSLHFQVPDEDIFEKMPIAF